MKRILCFGDSNTWGYVPEKDDCERRYPPEIRWTGRLQKYNSSLQVIEEGLNSRTTGLDDPDRPGRNGLTYLGPCLESHNPLDLVILMLGSNDLKKKFFTQSSPSQISGRVHRLIQLVKMLGKNAEGARSQILLVAPPHLQLTYIYELFQYPDLECRDRLLGPIYEKVAQDENIQFVDVGSRVKTSVVDGAHLDPDQHENLAQILFEKVSQIFCFSTGSGG